MGLLVSLVLLDAVLLLMALVEFHREREVKKIKQDFYRTKYDLYSLIDAMKSAGALVEHDD